MNLGVTKKAFAVVVSGAALFLTLGAGCNEQDNEDGDDRPGVENNEDNDQDDEGDG